MAMAYETILTDVGEDRVAVLTLNRPEAHNAIGQQMIDEIHDALGRWEDSDEVVALVRREIGPVAAFRQLPTLISSSPSRG